MSLVLEVDDDDDDDDDNGNDKQKITPYTGEEP